MMHTQALLSKLNTKGRDPCLRRDDGDLGGKLNKVRQWMKSLSDFFVDLVSNKNQRLNRLISLITSPALTAIPEEACPYFKKTKKQPYPYLSIDPTTINLPLNPQRHSCAGRNLVLMIRSSLRKKTSMMHSQALLSKLNTKGRDPCLVGMTLYSIYLLNKIFSLTT